LKRNLWDWELKMSVLWNPSISGNIKSFGLNTTSATVIDVVINEEHPDYGVDGFEVGRIRFKYTEYGGHRDTPQNAFYAYPIEVGVQEFPLIGETVMVQKIQGIHFYTRRVNINKTLQLNGFPNILNRSKSARTQQNRTDSIQQARQGAIDTRTDADEPEENLTNEKYSPRVGLNNLKSFDGDVIIQNRYGASIRLGSSQMEDALNQKTQVRNGTVILGPTKSQKNDSLILFRVGQRQTPNRTKETPYALVVEDINLDSSCFIMAENQVINLIFSSKFTTLKNLNKPYTTLDAQSDGSIKTQLSGNQTILNSGMVVLNSKETDILLSSQRDMISITNRDTIIDSGKNIYINSDGGKLFLGTVEKTNSVVKYNELESILYEILDYIEELARSIAIPYSPLSTSVFTKTSSTRLKIIEAKSNGVKIGNWTIYKGTIGVYYDK